MKNYQQRPSFRRGLCGIISVLLVFFAAGADGFGQTESNAPDFSIFASAQNSPSLSDLYDALPNIPKGFAGTLKDSEKKRVLEYLNAVRALSGLEPVEYNFNDDTKTAGAALMFVSNADIEHFPPKSWKNYNVPGAEAAGHSNIHIAMHTPGMAIEDSTSTIVDWLIDADVESLGHRRWLLDPFLDRVSFGRSDGRPLVTSKWEVTGAAIEVVNDTNRDNVGGAGDFVAYPYGHYPSILFKPDWYLSFSVISDRNDIWSNKEVDFSKATITVTAPNSKTIPVSSKNQNNDGFGLPNILYWKCAGLKSGTRYSVAIDNVRISGKVRSFTYWFSVE